MRYQGKPYGAAAEAVSSSPSQAEPGAGALLEIATFLARCWSGLPGASVEIAGGGGGHGGGGSNSNSNSNSNSSSSNNNRGGSSRPGTRLADGRITLPPLGGYRGGGLERYRQFRTALWYESMRLAHCTKILSNDHAFGFILNTVETRRIEGLGRRTWRGMDTEIMFGHAYALGYRPPMDSLYGRARIVEAFYQAFMFGGIKGEIQSGHLERVWRAAALAGRIVSEALDEKDAENQEAVRGTAWVEGRVPEIVRILGIDPLMTVPASSLPWARLRREGMALSKEEVARALAGAAESRGWDQDMAADPASVIGGGEVAGEYAAVLAEDRRNKNAAAAAAAADAETAVDGIRAPVAADGADASGIYDRDLICRLKARFRDWRSGWGEHHSYAGDEFDAEAHLDGGTAPFVSDTRKSVKTRIVILLDHSSSIHPVQAEYKKATLALCEVLSYLRISFSVYAFSTHDRSVVCWTIKPQNARWGSASAGRLARVAANGSTPLADVYKRMLPAMQSGRPEILMTLTDGEPSDPGAVRDRIRSMRAAGIRMVALGMGPGTVRATAIAGNLRTLGYERVLAVGRLEDIPDRVMGILRRD